MRVGVLLAGCGTHDGSDASEAILTLLELERQGAMPVPLAPACDQMHVVDHTSGDEQEGAVRSVAAESARLTRGRVADLADEPPQRLAALIVPGGSGTVKNLMTGFLRPGESRRLRPEAERLLRHFLEAGKPVGLMSVANFLLDGIIDTPLLAARAGTPGEPLLVDEERCLVYAPAWLTARSLPEVAAAVAGLVELVLHWAGRSR